jgi:mRNA interferase YafQ
MLRTISRKGRFKRDYRRELSGVHGKGLNQILGEALELLGNDVALPSRYEDHPLIGPWKGHRDCHIRPDLLLIYRKPDNDTLELVRLGSHSELF